MLLRLMLLALLSPLVLAATAQSAQAQPFSLRTATVQTPGHLVAKGTLRRAGSGVVLAEGTADDVCPPDGYGVWMQVKWNYTDGTSYSNYVNIAQEKCTERPVRFRISSGQPNVRSVTLFLREIKDVNFGDGIKKTLRVPAR